MATTDLPAPLNLTLYQGATFSLVITWKEGDPATPVNLTGYTGLMKIKSDNGTVVATLSTDDGNMVLGGTAGTITLTLTAEETAALDVAVNVYDLLLTSGADVATALVAGTATVRKGVSAS